MKVFEKMIRHFWSFKIFWPTLSKTVAHVRCPDVISTTFNPNNSFLVDKGFTVQHLLPTKQATVYIPPFFGKRDKFTKEKLMLTKRIGKALIHVERFNGRLKKFRMLDRIIPLSLQPVTSQLVFVESCLVNFQECLCK